jgi:hypothetical protein
MHAIAPLPTRRTHLDLTADVVMFGAFRVGKIAACHANAARTRQAILPTLRLACAVMRGLDPRIHRKKQFSRSGWIAGSSPAMTEDRTVQTTHARMKLPA